MTEITKIEDRRPKTENQITWLIFAFIVVFIYLFGLTIPLVGPDEPRYAQVAREMFLRSDWITPTLGGFNWFEKPVLLYWLQIVSYNIFGVAEFAARFGSALFGLGTVFALWILGNQWSVVGGRWSVEKTNTADQIPQTNFANWLAVIAASSVGLLVFARGASFDIILTFPITAALTAFFVFDLTQRRSDAGTQRDETQNSSQVTVYFLIFNFYFFIGAALLAKGLVGIVFPFAIVAFYYLLSRKFPPKIFVFSLFWGTILSLLVASLWYLPMYQKHGWTFVDEFFIQHHLQRFTSDKYKHWQPFWFFFVVLPLMTIPWLPFFLASIWNFFKNIFYRKTADNTEKTDSHITHHASRITNNSSLITFAFAWMLVPLVFFSLSGSKLPGYILPALPAALILTADFVYKFVQKSVPRKMSVQILAFLTFATVALLLQFVVPRYAAQDSVKDLVRAADAQGYASEKIVNLYTISHNLEFYAPQRLIRTSDGRQKQYDDFSVLVGEMKKQNTPQVLVLIPLVPLDEVLRSVPVESKIIGKNGESALVLIKPQN